MSKEVHLKDHNSEKKYFTLLPNILSRLGLNAFERSLYWAIRECCCGDNGSCTKSYENLAVMAGMSVNSVKRTLKTLEIDNKEICKPLIFIKKRYKENGSYDTSEITLNDIWDDNFNIFKIKIGKLSQSSPPPTQSPGEATQSPGVRPHRAQGEATQSYKQEPLNKNLSKDKTTTTSLKKGLSSSSFIISEEDKAAARSMYDSGMNRASRKETEDEVWDLSLMRMEQLVHIHGSIYVLAQFNYLIERHNRYIKNTRKSKNKLDPIDSSMKYLNKACKENFAGDPTNKKEE